MFGPAHTRPTPTRQAVSIAGTTERKRGILGAPLVLTIKVPDG
jgi:hypothetical protein